MDDDVKDFLDFIKSVTDSGNRIINSINSNKDPANEDLEMFVDFYNKY